MSVQRKIENVIMLLKKKKMISVPKVVDSSLLLKGKVALVVGGTGGIGNAISQSLLNSGCQVIVSGASKKSFEKVDAQISNNDDARKLVFNLADTNNYESKIEEAARIFGKIDILIYSAGVHSENSGYFDMIEDEYDRVMNVNLKAPFFLCQSFAKYIIQNKMKGHICLVSSSRGAEPAYSPYGISKWGLNGLTKGLAQELIPHGIVVNGVAPGSTATPLIGISKADSIATFDNSVGRLALPEEVANVVQMLVGETGDMIVGETIHISGGRGVFDIR